LTTTYNNNDSLNICFKLLFPLLVLKYLSLRTESPFPKKAS